MVFTLMEFHFFNLHALRPAMDTASASSTKYSPWERIGETQQLEDKIILFSLVDLDKPVTIYHPVINDLDRLSVRYRPWHVCIIALIWSQKRSHLNTCHRSIFLSINIAIFLIYLTRLWFMRFRKYLHT